VKPSESQAGYISLYHLHLRLPWSREDNHVIFTTPTYYAADAISMKFEECEELTVST
jgi:hypothetical protein